MNFCPKCNNLLEFSKTIQNNYELNIDDIIQKFTDDNLNISDLNNISIEDLIKNKNYILLKIEDKNKLLELIDKNSDLYNIYNICINCGYYEKIKNKTLILNKSSMFESKNKNDLIYVKYDKTLPHTRNYKCRNDKCKTHDNFEIKDAVSFRPNKNLYITYYICCICDSIWMA